MSRRITIEDTFRRAEFWRLLRARLGNNAGEVLAQKAGIGKKYLSRIINGEQRQGPAWRKLQAKLTDAELRQILPIKYQGERWSYNNFAPARMRAKNREARRE